MPSAGIDWIEEQPDILRSCADCPAATAEIIDELKRRAAMSPRRRARWCAHPGNDAETQEMVIVLTKDSCIPPHRHPERTETLCVLEGRAKAWFFNEEGHVVRCLHMTPPSGDGTFLYRTKPEEFHTLEVETEFFVFQETTRGPFDPSAAEVAAFAPAETNADAYVVFFGGLKQS
jgi:cupin fold WbuC family metalloprotein